LTDDGRWAVLSSLGLSSLFLPVPKIGVEQDGAGSQGHDHV
jgi:hypothetical protein